MFRPVEIPLRFALPPFDKGIIRQLTPDEKVAIFLFMTLNELLAKFQTEDDCKTYLVAKRWPDGVRCPKCDNEKVYTLKARPFHWVCKQCNKNGYRFSVISGTIFENTKYPLREWFTIIFLMYHSKKGMSAHQIYRTLGTGSYETAWYMCHRIRAAMQNEESQQLLSGEVEVDETFVGGKNKNRHADKRIPGSGTVGKTPVIGAISRKGKVLTKVIRTTDRETMEQFVKKTVSQSAQLVATDEHSGYDRLTAEGYVHQSVKHGQGEYVRGDVHTQNIDSFWALLKRGIVGSFHHVSKKYLPLYVEEFAFRHNHRKDPDIFGSIVAGC